MSRSSKLLSLASLITVSNRSPLPRAGTLALLLGLAAGSTSCEGRREVAVRVSVPAPDQSEAPVAGAGVVALPYDRDSVIASLEARAAEPRPHVAALDSLFRRFRGPFAAYTGLDYAATSLRDSLRVLREQLDSAPQNVPEQARLSKRVGQLADSLQRLERELGRARTQLDRARRSFVARSESLRTAVRQWEDSTYRGYDSIVRSLSSDRGREALTDTTNATGWAHFSLPRGRWWLYARAWDTSDPNAEWYWNIAVEGDTVVLSSRTGKRRPRY